VPLRGLANAIINKAIQTSRAATSKGRNLTRHETGQLRTELSDENVTAAVRFLRSISHPITGIIKSSNNAHAEYNCIYPLPAPTV
jgi:hypothetical protein